MFLFCLSSSCVPNGSNVSGLSIFNCPFGILYHLFIHCCNISLLHLYLYVNNQLMLNRICLLFFRCRPVSIKTYFVSLNQSVLVRLIILLLMEYKLLRYCQSCSLNTVYMHFYQNVMFTTITSDKWGSLEPNTKTQVSFSHRNTRSIRRKCDYLQTPTVDLWNNIYSRKSPRHQWI